MMTSLVKVSNCSQDKKFAFFLNKESPSYTVMLNTALHLSCLYASVTCFTHTHRRVIYN